MGLKRFLIVIDGTYGEGGGQIIRTALSLAVVLNQPIRLENIRAKRKNPGLAAQHLTAVRAAAMICDAELEGDELGSTRLTFVPRVQPIPGIYEFNVADARQGGSAGSATLVLQTIFLPLALAQQPSEVTIKGGTHVAWSPSFHYVRDVYLPTLAELGLTGRAELRAWGWYPAGEGEIKVEISGQVRINDHAGRLRTERGPLRQISGIAVASSLPAHIAQRMRNRAMNLLQEAQLPAAIEPRRVRSVTPGAGIFLVATYGDGHGSRVGFGALGKVGKPAEQVAEEAVADLLAFHKSGAALDKYLVDQLILPVASLGLPIALHAEQLTTHTLTNIWVVEQFFGTVTTVDHRRKIVVFEQRDKITI